MLLQSEHLGKMVQRLQAGCCGLSCQQYGTCERPDASQLATAGLEWWCTNGEGEEGNGPVGFCNKEKDVSASTLCGL